MKVVVDTNVVISGAIGKGETVNKLFDVLFDRHQLFSSDELINEAKEKLESVRLKKFVDPICKKGFIDKFLLHATILKPEMEVRVCRDADDDEVLSLALAANADYIISGDQELLVLHPFRNISIVSPSAFLDEAKM